MKPYLASCPYNELALISDLKYNAEKEIYEGVIGRIKINYQGPVDKETMDDLLKQAKQIATDIGPAMEWGQFNIPLDNVVEIQRRFFHIELDNVCGYHHISEISFNGKEPDAIDLMGYIKPIGAMDHKLRLALEGGEPYKLAMRALTTQTEGGTRIEKIISFDVVGMEDDEGAPP